MAKARTKRQLLESGEKEFGHLLGILGSLRPDHLTTQPVFANRTIKDVIAHLYAWQMLFLRWYEEGMAGQMPVKPAPGYTWKATPQLNEELYRTYKAIPLEEIVAKFKDSHRRIMGLIEAHSAPDLEEKGKYSWTGSTSLASYVAAATSSHYRWATTLIKKCGLSSR
jgi:hypothetical protein